VTADVVRALAQANDIPVVVQDLPAAEIGTWDEAFLTSTSRHVMPLVRIDGRALGHGRPGPVTQRLAELFEENFRREVAGTGK
jgi:branched-subunit amino acid aminotransferase/4-amino-4-deoxychorismate lyase